MTRTQNWFLSPLDSSSSKQLYDTIDLDHNDQITLDEFVNWITQTTSVMSQVIANVKIIVGLMQALSQLGGVMQLETPEWFTVMGTFALDFLALVPCVPQMGYYNTFALNVFLLPIAAFLVVAQFHFFDKDEFDEVEAMIYEQKSDESMQYDADGDGVVTDSEKVAGEAAKARTKHVASLARNKDKRSDYFLALFLVYPKVSQTLFRHFDCRVLAPGFEVLNTHYTYACAGGDWTMVAILAFFMILLVPIGIPVISWYLMAIKYEKEMKLFKKGGQSKAQAIAAFRVNWDFLSDDYIPEAYYFECLDLLRKMILTGAMLFVAPGTVFQVFFSALISYSYVLLHIKAWPYKHQQSNQLKALAEI